FFFSSRRRHTRWPRDWSSDVCSSDLCATGCAEDDAARLLATKLREIPNVSEYTHLRLTEVGSSGPRPLRILWRIAEPQVGKRYGAMTVGEFMKRFGAQPQH